MELKINANTSILLLKGGWVEELNGKTKYLCMVQNIFFSAY